MTSSTDIENRAAFSRATCGWRLAGLPLDAVWNYWRDVHSPAISRRVGVYIYRHYRFSPVRSEAFGGLAGIETAAPVDAQLQWLSDIIYRDQESLNAFYRSPETPELTSKILGDIEMIVDKSTTYLSVADQMATYLGDAESDPLRQGAPSGPHYGLFFRQGGAPEEAFRSAVRDVARQWTAVPGVTRVRVNLFERPDMEADKNAGYPVKTHPVELQYQAWIDLVFDEPSTAAELAPALVRHASVIDTVHAYPVSAVYTFVWDGVPTIVGLRGFPAYQAIEALGAEHAKDHGLLEWMYGPVVDGAVPQKIKETSR